MNIYEIVISVQARKDLLSLAAAISIDYSSPLTSKKYIDGVRNSINSLKHGAESYSIQTSIFYRQYGFNVRKISFKKMSIVYLIVNQYVYIKAIIPTSSIND